MGARVDGRRLRFDGDATDKTEYPESTASVCLPLSAHLYLRLAARTVSSASQTRLPACKAQAQAQTGRNMAHTNTHATLQSSAPVLVVAP